MSSTAVLSVPDFCGTFAVAPLWSLTSASAPDAPGPLHTLTVTIASSYLALTLVDLAITGRMQAVCLSFWDPGLEHRVDAVTFLPLRQIDLRWPAMTYSVVSAASHALLSSRVSHPVGESAPLLQLTFTGNVLAVHETFATNRDPQDALPTPAVGGMPSFAVATMFHTRKVHRVSRWDLFQHDVYTPRVHDLLEPGVRLAIREVLMIRRFRPEHPLSRVDLNVVFAICTHLLDLAWHTILRWPHNSSRQSAFRSLAQQRNIIRDRQSGHFWTFNDLVLSNSHSFGFRVPHPSQTGGLLHGDPHQFAMPTGVFGVAPDPAAAGPAAPTLGPRVKVAPDFLAAMMNHTTASSTWE